MDSLGCQAERINKRKEKDWGWRRERGECQGPATQPHILPHSKKQRKVYRIKVKTQRQKVDRII